MDVSLSQASKKVGAGRDAFRRFSSERHTCPRFQAEDLGPRKRSLLAQRRSMRLEDIGGSRRWLLRLRLGLGLRQGLGFDFDPHLWHVSRSGGLSPKPLASRAIRLSPEVPFR